MTIFGTIRSDDEVEEAVVSICRKWLNTYLAEVERQRGLTEGYYERPVHASFIAHSDFDKWPEEMLPVVTVAALAIEDDPQRTGRGIHRGRYGVGIVNTCSSLERQPTREYAARMGAAIRALMLQRGIEDQLDDSCQGVDFIGSRNNELPSDSDRTIWAYRQLFIIDIEDIVTSMAGPMEPDPEPEDPQAPYADWEVPGDRDHVIVDTEKEPIPS